MHRVLIVAPPRSATTTMFNHVRDSFFHTDYDSADPREAGEWSQRDSWVIVSHEPILLLADIDSTVTSTVVRNPIDFLASIITKHAYGFGDATIVGRPEIVEEHMRRIIENKDAWLEEEIHQESMMWEGYTSHTNKRVGSIIPFTFEQVTNNILTVIQNIHEETAKIDPNRGPVRLRTPEEIAETEAEWRKQQLKDINQSSGATNGFPIEKPAEYYEIKDAIVKFDRVKRLIDLYDDTIDKIHTRQKDFAFSFDNAVLESIVLPDEDQ